jgi:membrane peptidoglycan carboxypeptidase
MTGSILYEKEVVTEESVITPGAASLIREILSNTANMPSNWVNMFSVRGLKLAVKSGTSDVKTPNGARPRDGWLATYTPSRVAIFWVGNTDGAPMNRNAFWMNYIGIQYEIAIWMVAWVTIVSSMNHLPQ